MNKRFLSVEKDDDGLNTIQRRSLGNGQVEEIHTMPKKEYYASLRVGSNLSVARNIDRSNSNIALTQRYGTIPNSKSGTTVFKPSGKMITCNVTMLDGEDKAFEIDSASLGQQLFDRVIEDLDLSEKEYFCLKYDDKAMKIWFWLKMDKKISEQLKKNPWVFDFQVKFYTPHINSIQEDLTRYFFCLQVRQNIVQGIIPISFNIMVILGAYAVQSEAGDYDRASHYGIDYIKDMPFAPRGQQTDELLMFIAELHKQISLQSPEEADRNFIWNATKLGMYGVDMHKVKNTQNEEVSVGVYHSGILIYKDRVRSVKYSWPKILRLTYKNKSFFMMLRASVIDKKERQLEFKCNNHVLAKRLWRACVEHHSFFRMLDAENPGKPRLVPGFGTRKYRFGSNPSYSSDVEPNQTSPSIIINRPQAKVTRIKTQRKENEVLTSPSGIAPVAFNDEVDEMDDEINVTRPELPSEYWRMSADNSTPQIGMDSTGLDLAANEGAGWQGSRANKGVKGSGKYYYEGKVVEDGLIRLGWSTNDASLDLGSDKKGFGYGDDQAGTSSDKSFKRNNKEEKPYGQPVHEGDVIGCSIDLDNGKFQWSKNGIPFEVAYKIPEEMKKEAFFPASSIKDARVLFNFGDLPMEFMPTGDWKTLAEAPSNNVVPNQFTGWRMNPFDATKGTDVSENGLLIQSKLNDEWHGCRANKGLFDAGKYYYEVIPVEDGLARVGWATDEGNLNLGSDAKGFGYGADDDGFGLKGNQGKKMNGGEIDNYGDAFGNGDVIGCFLDIDNHTIKWSKNGQVFKEAFIIPEDLIEFRAFYATASLLNNTLDFNFGNKPFEFYPGNEWNPVCYAANGNTENSKKQNPILLNRPNVDRQEDVLELRRLHKDKLKKAADDAKRMKELEEEKKLMSIKEKERIEKQEMERRLLLQKEREEREREEEELMRRRIGQQKSEEEERRRLLEEERRRIIEEEQNKNRNLIRNSTNYEEESQTIIKGEPEVSTETYVDELGRTVTRILKKTKITTRTSMNRNTIERLEDEFSHNTTSRIRGLGFINEDEDELLRAILEVTRFNPMVKVLQGVNDLSMTSR